MTTECSSSTEYTEECYASSSTTSTTFQYINEDTCTSTVDDSTLPANDTEYHAGIILTYFHQLYQSQKGIDLEVFCDGISVAKVHRIVMASFCRMLDPIISGNTNSTLIKLDIPASIGVSMTDLREIINFLYTGKIVIENKSILRALDELGCNHILPLLYDVWEEGGGETIVEDKYHAVNLMNKFKDFCDKKKFIDCSLRLENGLEVSCHRYCIAAFSSIVESSLLEVEKTQVVFLELTELGSTSINAVSQLVNFIYTNDIPSSASDYEKLKEAAQIFGVDRLVAKLPAVIEMDEVEANEEQYFEESYDEESTSCFYDDHASSSTVTFDSNLTAENEYVNIYNQYVEGPMTASCSDLNGGESVPGTVKRSKSKIPRYKCPLCEFVSPIRGTIRKHIRSIHTLETPYSCQHCFMAFKVQSNLARHLRSHSQVKPYKCKSCGSAYADKKNMDAHIFRHHLKKEPFRCPHNCPRARFYREDSWRRHYQKFHSDLPEITFPSELLQEEGDLE